MIDSPTRQVIRRTTSVPHAFQAPVDRAPTAIAVESGERRLTYAQLDRLVNQVARRLRALLRSEEYRQNKRLERWTRRASSSGAWPAPIGR
jgi:non-ribosomal peptide synthetase component F